MMISSKVKKCIAITLIAEIIEKKEIQKWNEEKRKRRRRSIWTRKWILERNRSLRGIINLAHIDLRIEDQEYFQRFFRMRIDLFDQLVEIVTPYIQRQDTNMRQCISSKERISLTLRFLATGESYRSLEYSTRIPACTISRIIPETCRVIYELLRENYLKTPNTTVEWKQIADDYQRLWNVPNCIGSMDGRHIEFRAPLQDGSLYYNYKGTNSIVLLALVNAQYQFTYVNVGVNGRVSDGGVFRDSDFAKLLNNAQNPLNVPQDKSLPGMNEPIPYVILADAAFPLQNHLLKPYPSRNLSHDERICNYRISRGRRVVENVFGILANKFRVLLTQIHLPVGTVQNITLACCALHNYLIKENAAYLYTDIDNENLEHTTRSATWRNNTQLRNLEITNIRPNMNAIRIRDAFKEYFNTVGKVEWQEYMI
ncbi:PREDICTED: putative nuclease HARBI1 [Trachymyrmex cornetzi]|uniref:putative nuclease HARBI1 n=1 Tax=Trachymyrmex cornetzi TaxID=471704 RepID=UPI00084F4258|nr:PREDICTED: putative nuclease HARBI1 [Trachymyrmex cornetzi]XP_018377419.1 PREDICTED: putative nuclease HARBI1 [Trachymyrmex cornetzi]